MQRVLITGANRGNGLELTRQYLQREGMRVFGACRRPEAAADLNALVGIKPGHLTVVALDVTNAESIRAAEKIVADQVDGLDVLINNAGVNPRGGVQALEAITAETMLSILHVNAVAPLLVVKAHLDLLKAGTDPRIVNISSGMGSLTLRASGDSYGYCASKAALNMVTRSLAADLKPYGIITIAMHPGWVQTDMGGPNAPLPQRDSARGIIRVIDNLSPDDTGQFFRYDGELMPW